MARNFSGNDVLIASVERELTGSSVTSISAWVRPTSLTGFHTIAAKRTGGSATYQFRIGQNTGDAELTFTWTDGGDFQSYDPEGSTVLSADVWQHVGVRFDWSAPGSVRLYINGSGITITRLNGTGTTPDDANVPETIGRRHDDSMGFVGDIAEIAIWDDFVFNAEFEALARGISPRRIRPGNLASYVPVWGLHSPELDLTGSKTWAATGTTRANHAPAAPFTSFGGIPLIEEAAGTSDGVGSAAGVATASGTGQSIAEAAGASSGVAAATATGQATAEAVAASSGVATVTGIAQSVAEATASASGATTATATGQSTAEATAAASGTSTVVGQSIAGSVAASAGQATVSGVGASVVRADGAVTGIAVVNGVAQAITTGVAAAPGTATAAAISQAIAEAVAQSQGVATVTGVTDEALGGALDADVEMLSFFDADVEAEKILAGTITMRPR